MSMEITRTGYAQAAMAAAEAQAARSDAEKTEQASAPAAAQTDRVEISPQGREAALLETQKAVEALVDEKEKAEAAKVPETAEETSEDEEESGSKTAVAFNAEKRARQLAAAKTRGQVQQVMALLSQDLAECKAGLENGWCDESEVAKVEAMIRHAQNKMVQVAGNDEAEEPGLSAFDLAGLL